MSINSHAYYRDLDNVKILNREEQITLYNKMKLGDVDAKNKLVETCLRLSWKFTHNFCKHFKLLNLFDDLIQDASLIVIRSVELWNPDKGCLTTFAGDAIKRSLSKFINMKYYNQIRVPLDTFRQIRNNIDIDSQPHLSRRVALRNAKSIIDHEKFDVSDHQVKESVVVKTYEEDENVAKIEKILKTDFLTTREKELIKLRFVDGLKLKDIGNIFHISKEAIRQQIDRIIKKLQPKFIEIV